MTKGRTRKIIIIETEKQNFRVNYRLPDFVPATIITLQTKFCEEKSVFYLLNRICSNFVYNLHVNVEPVFNFRRLPSPVSHIVIYNPSPYCASQILQMKV